MTNCKLSKGLGQEDVLAAYHSLESLSSAELGELLSKSEDDPTSLPLPHRLRILWQLRERPDDESTGALMRALEGSTSPLLRHEVCYILGQKQDRRALDTLTHMLQDQQEDVMVRHEAAEALGALGFDEALEVLHSHAQDSHVEIAETCQLALARIEHVGTSSFRSSESSNKEGSNKIVVCACQEYASVDPAPPSDDDVPTAAKILLDASRSLWERYRAMFRLRNEGAVDELCAALSDSTSALFRHEVAFVLGQMEHPAASDALLAVLKDTQEHPMVRHECAEALGSIAKPSCLDALREYSADEARAVRESCVVALDMHAYWTQFYAMHKGSSEEEEVVQQ